MAEVSSDISCCTALDLFYLTTVSLCVWVPGGGGVFYSWSDKGCIHSFLDLTLTHMIKIPGEEASGAVGLLGDGINVFIKLQLIVQCDAKVFSRLSRALNHG